MKKLLTALGAAAVIAAMTMPVSAENCGSTAKPLPLTLLKHGTSRPPMATTYWNSLR